MQPKEIIHYIFENYEIKTVLDIQDTLNDTFAGTLDSMPDAKLDDYLGYYKNADDKAKNTNHRNDHSGKKIHSQLDLSEISVPRNRKGSFEPYLVPKRQKDVFNIKENFFQCIKGLSQRDIQSTIADI